MVVHVQVGKVVVRVCVRVVPVVCFIVNCDIVTHPPGALFVQQHSRNAQKEVVAGGNRWHAAFVVIRVQERIGPDDPGTVVTGGGTGTGALEQVGCVLVRVVVRMILGVDLLVFS